VCCSVLQCVAVHWSVLQSVAECCSVLQYNDDKTGGSQGGNSGAVCCSVLQCVAVCCSAAVQ